MDRVNAMTMAELRGPSFPPAAPQGALDGTQQLRPTESSQRQR